MLNTTDFSYINQGTKPRKTRTLEYSVPREIFHYIQMIQPITRFGPATRQRSFVVDKKSVPTVDVSPNCGSTITPSCLCDLYRLGVFQSETPFPRNKLEISGYLEEYARYRDLETFLHGYATNMKDPNFTAKSINGGANKQNSTADSVEASLDIEYGITLYPSSCKQIHVRDFASMDI